MLGPKTLLFEYLDPLGLGLGFRKWPRPKSVRDLDPLNPEPPNSKALKALNPKLNSKP